MKLILSLIILFSSLTLAAQNTGIQFHNDTVFDNVLAKARAENKLIFIDCYAVWCGPCKYMDANIFPDKELGEFHNENFINLKYDMEKPYGMKIRKNYGIKAYPSFLYLDGNGEVVHRFVGSTAKPADFLTISRLATDTENNFRAVNQRILQGDRRATTINDYLKMNYGATNADSLINDHFRLVNEQEKMSKSTWELMKNHGSSFDGAAFHHFKANIQAYLKAFGEEATNEYIYSVMSQTYRKSPTDYETLKALNPTLYDQHQREINFRKANSSFSKDKTSKEAWNEYISRAGEFITGNSPHPGYINSIARNIIDNYATFKDKASVVKAVEWVQTALKASPDNKELSSVYAELLKAAGSKK